MAEDMRMRRPPSLSLRPAAPPSLRNRVSARRVKLYTWMALARSGPARRSMAFSVSKEYCSGTSITQPPSPERLRSASIRRRYSVFPLPARPRTNCSMNAPPVYTINKARKPEKLLSHYNIFLRVVTRKPRPKIEARPSGGFRNQTISEAPHKAPPP